MRRNDVTISVSVMLIGLKARSTPVSLLMRCNTTGLAIIRASRIDGRTIPVSCNDAST